MPLEFGKSTGRAIRSVGALSAVGLSLVVAVVIGAGLGYLLDGWLGTSPWLFLVCFFLGLAAGIRTVFRTVAAVSGGPADSGKP
jgi:F0F1-type ATP synthase assembly protein I